MATQPEDSSLKNSNDDIPEIIAEEKSAVESDEQFSNVENPERYIKEQQGITDAELKMIETGADLANEKVKKVDDPVVAEAFIAQNEAFVNESNSIEEDLGSEVKEVVDDEAEPNESDNHEKLVEIKSLLTTLYSAKLKPSDKRKVLDGLIKQVGELYGTGIDIMEQNALNNPDLQETYALIHQIEESILGDDQNDVVSNAIAPETISEENKDENGNVENIEINNDSISETIRNNEVLSIEQETYLLNRSEDISKKKLEEITDEDKAALNLYLEATNKNLTRQSMEANTLINNEIPEIKEYNEKSDEEKDKEINERLEKIKSSEIELGNSAEEAKNNLKKLKEQYEEKLSEFAKMETDLEKIRNADGVDEASVEVLTNTIISLKNIYKDKLYIEYYEYWIDSQAEGGIKNLRESHAQRNLSMKNWEKLDEQLAGDLESIEKGEKEVLRAWAQYIKDHPKTGLALLTAALIAGIVLSPYLAKMLATENVAALATPAGKGLIAAGAKAVAGLASATGSIVSAGMLAAGLGIAAFKLFSEENRDKAMVWLCGRPIPGFASWGLKKKGEK